MRLMAKTNPSGESPRSRLHQPPDLDLNEFFRNEDGGRTIVKNSDLEATIPNNEKYHLVEEKRYWVNKPYAFVVIYKSQRDQEYRYYLVEPYLTPEEKQLVGFLKDKIRHTLDFQQIRARASERERAITLRETTFDLLREYNLISQGTLHDEAQPNPLAKLVNNAIDKLYEHTSAEKMSEGTEFAGEETVELEWEQAQKIVYYIIRDFIRFDRIDGIAADSQVEDVSIDGWNSSVFVVHTEYGQMITNVTFGEEDLDEFVTAIAQKAEKGISKRQPNVDATLQDGSRALLMLGDEVTDKGSNFTIRQFNNIPFTPIDLINWRTYSLDQMVYLWLAVENHKSAIVAGGTASGKTTTLNAMSMFIPATNKIVSIEDTREIQIPQSNWVPLVTRDSFGEQSENRIDEFDLLRDSLRMRPNYVIFGEVRGEEARSLFQNLNTGHTTYATFHAKNSEQVRVRLTTDPINVDETSFGGLDLILNQQEVSISGHSERRAKEIVELREYDATDEKFEIETPFVWNQATDEVEGQLTTPAMESISPLIDEIRHENGWSKEELREEINRRRVVLSYLLSRDMTAYTQVAATLQGYMYSKESVLSAIAEDVLASNTSQFRQMKNIDFEVTPEAEENVPRPPVRAEKKAMANEILEAHEDLYMDISIDARYQRPVSELEGETVEPPEEQPETSSDETDTEQEYGYYPSDKDGTDDESSDIVTSEGKTAAIPEDQPDEPAVDLGTDDGNPDPSDEQLNTSADELETDTEQTAESAEQLNTAADTIETDKEVPDSPEAQLHESSDGLETDQGETDQPNEQLDEVTDAPETGQEASDAPEHRVDDSSDNTETDTEKTAPSDEKLDEPAENLGSDEEETDLLDEQFDEAADDCKTDKEDTDSPETGLDDSSDDPETDTKETDLSANRPDESSVDLKTGDADAASTETSPDDLGTDKNEDPVGDQTDTSTSNFETAVDDDSFEGWTYASSDDLETDTADVDSSEDRTDASSTGYETNTAYRPYPPELHRATIEDDDTTESTESDQSEDQTDTSSAGVETGDGESNQAEDWTDTPSDDPETSEDEDPFEQWRYTSSERSETGEDEQSGEDEGASSDDLETSEDKDPFEDWTYTASDESETDEDEDQTATSWNALDLENETDEPQGPEGDTSGGDQE